MSQIASRNEENLATPLGKSKMDQNRMSNTNTNDKSRKELAKKNMNIDSAQPSLSNLDENDFSYQKLGFLEELGKHEEEIRKMLYESKPNTKTNKEVVQEKMNQTNRKNIYADLTGHHSDDEECTFKPKINPKTKKLAKRQNSDLPINEILYKSAFDKKAKEKEAEAEARQNASKMSNTHKISINSMKIVFKRIETALRNLIHDTENPEHPEYLSFENLGILLQRLGVFKNLDFAQSEEVTNRSSLSINQSKGKAQEKAREVAFHENLWKTLVSTSDTWNFIPSELIFRFLMVLFEDKATVAESSMVLQEIMNLGLEEKGITKDSESAAFEKIKKEYILWDMDKVVTEFRKLFNDKTAFMNIYSNTNNIARSTVDEKQTFRPQINAKSKNLDLRSTGENYKNKVRASTDQLVSPDKLQNRFEMLFGYHKYLKERKNGSVETKLEQELANCTFKPQITEYKKKGGDQSSLLYSSQDLSKAKRHDLLYDVARVQKEKQTQKAYEMKKQEETKELSQCTFQPRTNAGFNDYSREQATTGYAPKGYKKTVERMKVAERMRETKKAEREHIPRGENYEKLKNSNFKPPSFLSRPKNRKNDALVYVDVNIGPGKTGRIGIHRGDDARTLAKNFARTYSLPTVMRESLEKLLQTYIDSYFPEHEEEEEEQEGQEQERGSEEEGEEEDVLEEEHEEDEEDEEERDVYQQERHDEMRQRVQNMQNRGPVREHEEEEEEDEDEDDDDDDDLDLDQKSGEEDDDDDDDDEDDDDEEDVTPVKHMRNQQQRIPAKKI